jgi:PAS domain-containing protein
MTRVPWWAFLAANLVATGAYFVLPATGTARAWLYMSIFAVALVVVIAAVRATRPAGAVVWWAVVAGQTVNLGAGVAWYLYPALKGVVLPYPSVGDFLYLCSYPVYAIALGVLIRKRGEGSRRVELIDAAIIAVGAAVLSWVFLIAPNLFNTSLPPLARAVSIGFPLQDLVLLAWVTGQLLGDTIFALSALDGSFHLGHATFAGWLGAYGFLGAAALHPTITTLATPQPERGLGQRRRRITLAAAGLLAPSVLIIHGLQSRNVDSVVIAAAAAVLVLLILARLGRVIDVLERAEVQLTRSQAQLMEAQHRAQVGSFELDLVDTGQVSGSAEFFRILGVESISGLDTMMGLIHPDDQADAEAVLARIAHYPMPFELQVRIIRPDGAVRTLFCRGESISDATGRVVRAADTIARLGGDEFAILLEGAGDHEATHVAERILDALQPPVELDGTKVAVHASIGIAQHGGPEDAGVMLRNADLAMYAAKRG